MRKHDARKLDHATLEALRERAVQRVQEGESPEVVARVFGIGRTAIYWLVARGIPARRLGRTEGEAAFRKAAEAGRQEAAVGIQHGDPEEPVTTEVRVCAMDPRDGGQAHQGQSSCIKLSASLSGASVGATRHHLPEAIASCDRTRRGSGAASGSEGISENQGDGSKRRGRDIFRRRGSHTFRSPRGAELGQTRRNADRRSKRAPATA